MSKQSPAAAGVATVVCCTPLAAEPLNEVEAAELGPLFSAIANPVRLRLLSLIACHAGGEACVCELTGAFDVTGPTISHHLKVLREAGLIGPVSGAHLNPVVSLADWALGRSTRTGLTVRDLAAYLPAQIAGAVGGAVLANLMFALPAVTASTRDRSGAHLWLGEMVATAGLIAVIFALTRTGRANLVPAAAGAWIGAAYWFTSSTSFANPAVTVGRT